MNYKIISSGSQGNAIIIENKILVDCGISFKKIKKGLKDVRYVLLTHIHTDHFKPSTLRSIYENYPQIKFIVPEWLYGPLRDCGVRNIFIAKINAVMRFGDVTISPFKLYHNVPNCGWRVFVNGKKYIYATDTRTLEGISAKGYDCYLIEGNYGEEEIQERIKEKLEKGLFCYELNVSNRHLSVEQATEWILNNMNDGSVYELIHCHKEE